MARLFADEDFPFPVVQRLRQLGHDVLTTVEAGRANKRLTDADQLAFATGAGRAILTRNRRHFIPLHKSTARHAGIIRSRTIRTLTVKGRALIARWPVVQPWPVSISA
jgi:Domain of unknown function (DUF5615)